MLHMSHLKSMDSQFLKPSSFPSVFFEKTSIATAFVGTLMASSMAISTTTCHPLTPLAFCSPQDKTANVGVFRKILNVKFKDVAT